MSRYFLKISHHLYYFKKQIIMENNKITPLGYLLLGTFFIFLSYAGWIYTKSIDWKVLERLEDAPLSIPTGNISLPSTLSATPQSNPKK